MTKTVIFNTTIDNTLRLTYEPENIKRFYIHDQDNRHVIYVNFEHLLNQFKLSKNHIYNNIDLKNPVNKNKMTFTYEQSEVDDNSKVIYHSYMLRTLINGHRWRVVLVTTTKEFNDIISRISDKLS